MREKWRKFFWRKFIEALEAKNYTLALHLAEVIEKEKNQTSKPEDFHHD